MPNWVEGKLNFYPRPPRGGRLTGDVDLNHAYKFLSTPSARRATLATIENFQVQVFLSTPSARRATSMAVARRITLRYFYPRPPRGGRPGERRQHGADRGISIHALREEGDQWPWEASFSIC